MWVKLGSAYNIDGRGAKSQSENVRVRAVSNNDKYSHIRVAIGESICTKMKIKSGSSILVSAETNGSGKFTGRYRITPCSVNERTCKVFTIGKGSKQLTAQVPVPTKLVFPVQDAEWHLSSKSLLLRIPTKSTEEASTRRKKYNITPEGLKALRKNAANARAKRLALLLKRAESGR